jgi:acetyl esterase/lipase
VSTQSYTYKTIGGCAIQADVYRRPDGQAHPAILWVHGGALITGERGAILSDQRERYLAAGYTVISIDYRLAPETKLPAIIEDLQDAYRWVCAEGPTRLQIDPQRIAVVGHSAGGYLTLMAGFCVHPHPKALVSFYGYGDIVGAWYSRPDPFYSQQPLVSAEEARAAVGVAPIAGSSSGPRFRFYLYCRQHGLWPKEVTGHDPDREAEWFAPYCPLRNVGRDYPPTLLIHGQQDTDVPFEQSVLMERELARQGVEHEFLALPDRGHGFDHAGMQDPVVVGVFDRVLGFLRQHGV